MKSAPENRNETAAKILDAADELLVEVGRDGLRARAIADRAGVNNALVFYYFGSIEGLVERVIERYYRRHLRALEDAFAAEGPLCERLHRVLDAYLDFIETNLRYPRLVQQQVAGAPVFHELIRKHLAPLYEWVRDALAEVAPDQGPLSARHLFISISGIVINYYTYGQVLGPLWDLDPFGASALVERREHVHWLTDALLDRLQKVAVAA
ncbi:MAG: hypothetical protein CSA66_04745 [Proteobacteria bacterium]|nr:MAG: hypothetical protein CSA66_04745 [Pseudomonadota bacterium]